VLEFEVLIGRCSNILLLHKLLTRQLAFSWTRSAGLNVQQRRWLFENERQSMDTDNSRGNTDRFGPLWIGLHWLMVLLIAAVYACMELSDFAPKGSELRDGMKMWHYMLGLSVLALVVVRLLVRAGSRVPSIVPLPVRWQTLSAKLMHLGLYALMVGMPIVGWLTLSAQGHPIPFFGLQLPPLIGASKSTAQWIKDIHEIGATVGYFLIGLHAAAALFHHYFVRDNTLIRMLPLRMTSGKRKAVL
jgi:cytochrome b561